MLVRPMGSRKLIGTPGARSGPDRLVRERWHATSTVVPGCGAQNLCVSAGQTWIRRRESNPETPDYGAVALRLGRAPGPAQPRVTQARSVSTSGSGRRQPSEHRPGADIPPQRQARLPRFDVVTTPRPVAPGSRRVLDSRTVLAMNTITESGTARESRHAGASEGRSRFRSGRCLSA